MHPFEKMNQMATPWVESMMAELSTEDPHKALSALGAGLKALRARLTTEEAARFGAWLPLLIRGLFFEGWDPTIKPREIHQRSELLALVREKYAPRSDMPTDAIAAAFLAVLDRQLGTAEMAEVASKFPTLVIDFGWPGIVRKPDRAPMQLAR
jgi:uncharacterized protein (DUF2267 family)